MSKQEDFGRPEKPLEKTQEIDNEARISKEAEMKKKKKNQQKSESHNSVRYPAKLSNILVLILNERLDRHFLRGHVVT